MNTSSKILSYVTTCDDKAKLKQLIVNAKAKGDKEVEAAAFRRYIAVAPAEKPGTLEYDFWQTIHAFELVLTEERGKTTRLSRTRQKVARSGVVATLEAWAQGKETEGFKMLMERGMPELAGEAIILRHPSCFSAETQAAAKEQLVKANVDPAALASHPDLSIRAE